MSDLALNHYVCPLGYGVEGFLNDAVELGVGSVGLTRAALEEIPVSQLQKMLDGRGLSVSSLNSAGYFTFADASRRAQQNNDSARLIDTAAQLGAGTLCVITGGLEECASLGDARSRIADGLAHLDEQAAKAGVKLGLEPIHPVGMLSKGCINSIAQAREIIGPLKATGLILDLYHSWWDDDLLSALEEIPQRINLIQICNVILNEDAVPRRSTKLDQGRVDVPGFLNATRRAGYDGQFEFEIFARDHDGANTRSILAHAVAAFDGWADA